MISWNPSEPITVLQPIVVLSSMIEPFFITVNGPILTLLPMITPFSITDDLSMLQLLPICVWKSNLL